MSRVLPILFNEEMVQAILGGKKTCTRRIIKFPINRYIHTAPLADKVKVHNRPLLLNIGKASFSEEPFYVFDVKTPYNLNDILYVRETWRVAAWDERKQMIAFAYKDGTYGDFVSIDDKELFDRLVNQSREDTGKAKCEYNGVDFVQKKDKSLCRWHPSIHMPKEAARIYLKVINVRAERLQDINGRDIIKEGVNCYVHPQASCFDMSQRELFSKLWDSTVNKKQIKIYGWDANPWVWVIEFEKIEIAG